MAIHFLLLKLLSAGDHCYSTEQPVFLDKSPEYWDLPAMLMQCSVTQADFQRFVSCVMAILSKVETVMSLEGLLLFL